MQMREAVHEQSSLECEQEFLHTHLELVHLLSGVLVSEHKLNV